MSFARRLENDDGVESIAGLEDMESGGGESVSGEGAAETIIVYDERSRHR